MEYKGEMQFIAENSTGYKIPIEPLAAMGGSGKVPNPIDYLITGLAGCTGIKMITENMDGGTAVKAIENTIMHICPVAAMFRKTVEITWESHFTE